LAQYKYKTKIQADNEEFVRLYSDLLEPISESDDYMIIVMPHKLRRYIRADESALKLHPPTRQHQVKQESE